MKSRLPNHLTGKPVDDEWPDKPERAKALTDLQRLGQECERHLTLEEQDTIRRALRRSVAVKGTMFRATRPPHGRK